MPSDSLHPRPDSAHPAPDADTARQTAGGRAASGPTSGSDGQAGTYRATIPREIWVLVSAAVIVALGYGLIAPLLPQFVVSFDVSSGAAGAVVAVFSASRLLFAPVAGHLVNTFGYRRIYLIGLFTVGVTTGLVSLAQNFWQVFGLRAAAGIGSTMFTVSAMGLIVRLAPPSIRGRASATYSTAFLLGNVVGPLVGAMLAVLGFRWPFFIYGVGVIIAAVTVWLMMPKHVDRRDAGTQLPPMRVQQAWRDTAYRAVLTSNFAHGWINMGVRVSILPLFAATIFTHSGAVAGLALAAFAAGNAIVLQFSGTLADAHGRRPFIMLGLTLTTVFTAAMGFVDSAPALLVVSFLAGGSSGLINPAQQATLGDVIGNQRSGGQVLSSFQMAMDLGQIIGPIAIGALADLYSFRVAFLLCATIAPIGVVAWAFAREPLKRTRVEETAK